MAVSLEKDPLDPLLAFHGQAHHRKHSVDPKEAAPASHGCLSFVHVEVVPIEVPSELAPPESGKVMVVASELPLMSQVFVAFF